METLAADRNCSRSVKRMHFSYSPDTHSPFRHDRTQQHFPGPTLHLEFPSLEAGAGKPVLRGHIAVLGFVGLKGLCHTLLLTVKSQSIHKNMSMAGLSKIGHKFRFHIFHIPPPIFSQPFKNVNTTLKSQK